MIDFHQYKFPLLLHLLSLFSEYGTTLSLLPALHICMHHKPNYIIMFVNHHWMNFALKKKKNCLGTDGEKAPEEKKGKVRGFHCDCSLQVEIYRITFIVKQSKCYWRWCLHPWYCLAVFSEFICHLIFQSLFYCKLFVC